MKGRHCPRLPGPRRHPRQGVNADAADSQVLFITPFKGSRPRVSPSVSAAKKRLITTANWQRVLGPRTDKHVEKLGCAVYCEHL